MSDTATGDPAPHAGRPRMPATYGTPTEGSGLPWTWVTDRLERSPNYWICSTRPDGRPHAMPVWGVWVDGAVWFGTDPDSTKARNLVRRPEVVVHLESGDEAVIVEGSAEVHEVGGDLLAALDDAYGAKYVDPQSGEPFRLSQGAPTASAWRVTPRRVLAWLESDFLTSPSAFDLA